MTSSAQYAKGFEIGFRGAPAEYFIKLARQMGWTGAARREARAGFEAGKQIADAQGDELFMIVAERDEAVGR